jgi:hypothetical protein
MQVPKGKYRLELELRPGESLAKQPDTSDYGGAGTGLKKPRHGDKYWVVSGTVCTRTCLERDVRWYMSET